MVAPGRPGPATPILQWLGWLRRGAGWCRVRVIETHASGRLPAVVAHADWSVDPGKRWVACAAHEGGGRYRALMPGPAGPLPDLFGGLRRSAACPGAVLFGFDFPLGLPLAYARRAGVEDFRRLLPTLGRGAWRDFFSVAERAEEVSLARPFYPARAGKRGTVARRHLVEGLGLGSYDDLLRRCDRAGGRRTAACAMFWTLGPQQVGKAAIVGWRDLLIPALRGSHDLALWPFDGGLGELLAGRDIVAAETYPAEVYGHLGLGFGTGAGGKRAQAARAAQAPRLLQRAGDLGLGLDRRLRDAIADGFGPAPDGEDPFDATVGLLGMVNVVLGRRPAGAPGDAGVRRIEGWILGQMEAV